MLGVVRYLADPKVNLDLNNLYKDAKDKTHVEEFGKNGGNDYIKVIKSFLLYGGITALAIGLYLMFVKHDKKKGGFMIFGGVLSVILASILFLADNS